MPSELNPRAVSVIVCATITAALATLVVILRLITRARILKFLGKDDWCIVIALFFSMCNTVSMCLQAKWAFGRHFNTLNENQIDIFMHPFYFSVLTYGLGLTFTKISILLLYLRLFESSRTRYGCYILLGIVVTYGTWLFFCSVFPCIPIAKFWDGRIPGHCLPDAKIWYANASLNIITDLAIFILPQKTIYSLKLPKGQKISLCIVFAFGFCVCIISIIRLPALHLAATTPDPTWNNIGIANWSCIELNAAITCASLSTLKPLISRFFPNLLPSAGAINYFTTGGVVEGSSGASDTIVGSTGGSEGGAPSGSQADSDMVYKEDNFGIMGVLELKTNASEAVTKDLER